MAQDYKPKLIKKGGKSEMFRFDVDYTKPSILNDYKKLANNITQSADMFGRLPLIIFTITSFGTYYFYKKNKLKTAAAFGAIPMFFLIQPITRRLIKPFKPNKEPQN